MPIKPKVGVILGTRPEIIKLSPVIRELQKTHTPFFILHTNQHYSSNMDEVFFKELHLPSPDYNLNIQETLHGKMTARMLEKIEEVLMNEKPDWVLVQGDTNTVLAGALAAAKLGIKIGHVEAGLRSYDRTMPEEINRVVVDHLSDLLFAPTTNQGYILREEGIDKKIIAVTGNTIVDAISQNLAIAEKEELLNKYTQLDQKYFLLTMHRPSNVDDKKTFVEIINALTSLSDEFHIPVYFPIHPRTRKHMEEFKIAFDPKKIVLMDPVGYLEMLMLEKHAKLIITDSGGIQEEACILRVPCLTLRKNTERPETVDVGANILIGSSLHEITYFGHLMIKKKRSWKNPFGNGNSSYKIINSIINNGVKKR